MDPATREQFRREIASDFQDALARPAVTPQAMARKWHDIDQLGSTLEPARTIIDAAKQDIDWLTDTLEAAQRRIADLESARPVALVDLAAAPDPATASRDLAGSAGALPPKGTG